MKKIFFAAVAALALVACSGEKPNPNAYTINGTVTGADGETVYLLADGDTLASTTVQNGAFTFNGVADPSKEAKIYINRKLNDGLFLEPGVINHNINEQIASGTPLNDEMNAINSKFKALVEAMDVEGANEDSLVQFYYSIVEDVSQKHAGDALGLSLFKLKLLTNDFSKAQLDSVMNLYPLYAADPELKQQAETRRYQRRQLPDSPISTSWVWIPRRARRPNSPNCWPRANLLSSTSGHRGVVPAVQRSITAFLSMPRSTRTR